MACTTAGSSFHPFSFPSPPPSLPAALTTGRSSQSRRNIVARLAMASSLIPTTPLKRAHLVVLRCHLSSQGELYPSTHPFIANPQEEEEEDVYTSAMKDDPLGFWEKSSYSSSSTASSDESTMVWAKLRLLQNISQDRAAMHTLLMQERDNWNHLLQRSLTSFLMTASVLASMDACFHSLSMSLSSGLLDLGSGLIMCLTSHFQPSQLAEEQRTAALLFTRLANDIDLSLSLPLELAQDATSYLADCKDRLHALDLAYPMALTPNGLDKFPANVTSPIWGCPPSDKSKMRIHPQNGWTEKICDELLTTVALLRSSDEVYYLDQARQIQRLNKSLALLSPVMAFAAGALNLVDVLALAAPSHHETTAVLAAICSIGAGMAGSLGHDAQLGMIFELFRNNAGYYADIATSVERSLFQNEEGEGGRKRENGVLVRERLAYKLGRRSENYPLVPDNDKMAGILF